MVTASYLDLSDRRNSLTLRLSADGCLELAMSLTPETIAAAAAGLSELAANTVDTGSERGGHVVSFPLEQTFITAAARDALHAVDVVPHPGELPE